MDAVLAAGLTIATLAECRGQQKGQLGQPLDGQLVAIVSVFSEITCGITMCRSESDECATPRAVRRKPLVVDIAVAYLSRAAESIVHVKFAASSVLPVPFHRATCG